MSITKTYLLALYEALLLQSQIAQLRHLENRVLAAVKHHFERPHHDLGGKMKTFLSNPQDLVTLNAPTEADYLSNFLRRHWRSQVSVICERAINEDEKLSGGKIKLNSVNSAILVGYLPLDSLIQAFDVFVRGFLGLCSDGIIEGRLRLANAGDVGAARALLDVLLKTVGAFAFN